MGQQDARYVKVLVFEFQDWWKEKNQLPPKSCPSSNCLPHTYIHTHTIIGVLTCLCYNCREQTERSSANLYRRVYMFSGEVVFCRSEKLGF